MPQGKVPSAIVEMLEYRVTHPDSWEVDANENYVTDSRSQGIFRVRSYERGEWG